MPAVRRLGRAGALVTMMLIWLPHALTKAAKIPQAQRCSNYISWVMRVGIKEHPERFPGLSRNSSRTEIQHRCDASVVFERTIHCSRASFL